MDIIREPQDIVNFINLLSFENKQKLLKDINKLVISDYLNLNNNNSVFKNSETKYQTEVNEVARSVSDNKENFDKVSNSGGFINYQNPLKIKPGDFPRVMSNFPKYNLISNPIPTMPPPPPPEIPKQTPQKRILVIEELLNYVTPYLTEKGKKLVNPETKLESNSETYDIFKFLRLVNGFNNLSFIKAILYTNISPALFLAKVYFILQNDYIKLIRNSSLPEEVDLAYKLGDFLVSFEFLDQEQLNYALTTQRKENMKHKEHTNFQAFSVNVSELKKHKRILFGDILIYLNYITQSQLSYTLNIQRWFKEIIDS